MTALKRKPAVLFVLGLCVLFMFLPGITFPSWGYYAVIPNAVALLVLFLLLAL